MDANELLLTLQENPKNPRTITPDDFEKLKFKIRNFPQMLEKRPIAYDSSDNYIVLGGNRRLNALQDLVKEGFVVKPEYFTDCNGWTPEQKRTFVILDNVSDGEWNYELLANEWSDLPLEEWGLDPAEWEKKKEVTEDEPPAVNETEPAVSQLGEVYQLGRHRLLCGDATKIEDVERLMEGESADFVYTDPPYGINIVQSASDGGGGLTHFGSVGGEKMVKTTPYSPVIGDDSIQTAIDAYNLCASFKIKTLIFWGANYYAQSLPNSSCWVVWDKQNTGNFADCEMAWTNIQKSAKIYKQTWNGMVREGESEKRVHPTQKPVGLAFFCLTEFGDKEDKVLDLFGGSGSTLIACEQTNRTCYMMELDTKYCDVIRKRYAKFIGRENDWKEIK